MASTAPNHLLLLLLSCVLMDIVVGTPSNSASMKNNDQETETYSETNIWE